MNELTDPNDASKAAHRWRLDASVAAARLQFRVAQQEKRNSDDQKDALGGSSLTYFSSSWTPPLPSMVGRVLNVERPIQQLVFYMSADPEHESTEELAPCNTLKLQNKHSMDDRLTFKAAEHQYFYDGSLVVSVPRTAL